MSANPDGAASLREDACADVIHAATARERTDHFGLAARGFRALGLASAKRHRARDHRRLQHPLLDARHRARPQHRGRRFAAHGSPAPRRARLLGLSLRKLSERRPRRSRWRHLAVLAGAAVVVGAGVLFVQRLPASGAGEVSESLWLRGAQLALLPSLARGVISIVTVGMGVSLGREAAPQLAGAATASRISDWAGLPLWQRRLLVASGAGAGMAAVYNVPLGGALFALEVLLGTLALPLVLPAITTSVIATAVAWITLGTHPTYAVPNYAVHPSQLVWAALMGPLAGLLAVAWVRLIARANALRPRHHGRYAAPLVILLLGLISDPLPATARQRAGHRPIGLRRRSLDRGARSSARAKPWPPLPASDPALQEGYSPPHSPLASSSPASPGSRGHTCGRERRPAATR